MRASNARPYELRSVPTKTAASGMGKPIPYTVRCIAVGRCRNGFVGIFDTGTPQYAYP